MTNLKYDVYTVKKPSLIKVCKNHIRFDCEPVLARKNRSL